MLKMQDKKIITEKLIEMNPEELFGLSCEFKIFGFIYESTGTLTN